MAQESLFKLMPSFTREDLESSFLVESMEYVKVGPKTVKQLPLATADTLDNEYTQTPKGKIQFVDTATGITLDVHTHHA